MIRIHEEIFELFRAALYKHNIELLDLNPSSYYLWKEVESNNYKFNWIRYSQTDRTKISAMAINKGFYCSPMLSQYAEQGTHIKPAKLLQALLPNLPLDIITLVGQTIGTLLRQRGIMAYDAISVSPKPSEIYTIPAGTFNSCMNNQPGSFFYLYDDLPICSIAYHITEGKVSGRALLWDCVDIGGNQSVRVMDRIYYNNDDILVLFKAWAHKNGYAHKLSQSISDPNLVFPDGATVYCDMRIDTHNLTSTGYENLPYLDTFQRYSYKQLSNYGGYDTELNQTNGGDSCGYIVVKGERCENCNETHEVLSHGLCEDCFNDAYTYVNCCGRFIPNEDVLCINDNYWVCQNCYDRYYDTCYGCNETFHNNELTLGYCESCAPDYIMECWECGDTILIEDSIGDYCNYCGVECKRCAESILYTDEYCPECFRDNFYDALISIGISDKEVLSWI